LSNEEKTNDYENFEKGMIYMKILKKGGVVEKRGRRKRNCNFSREEVVLILREVETNYIIINLKHSNIITNEKKKSMD
jgi:hypothetical protein